VETVVVAPLRGVRHARPRMRNVGVAQGVAGAALLVALDLGSFEGCSGAAANPIPAGFALGLIVVLAAAAMIARAPRVSAVAPALSLGAALPLLGGALAGWVWVASQTCVDNMLDQEVVTLLIVTAAAGAVAGTSVWLLIVRREIEPWFGSVGVATSATGAVSLVLLGLTFGMVLQPGAGTVHTLLLVVPWALAVAATGWLRRSPALAVVTPAACQAVWLLVV
jgi:hypothetical protein